MATTRPCRSWPGAGRSPAASGPMSATTGPSAAARRRRRSTSLRAIAGRNIPIAISPAQRYPAGRRLRRIQRALRSSRAPGDHVGLCWAHAGGSSSNWPISRPMPARKNAAAISPVALEAVKRIDALFDIERGINGLSADERLRVRLSTGAASRRSRSVAARPAIPPVALVLRRQADRLHAQALGSLRPLPRRWPICLTNNAPNAPCADLHSVASLALRRLRTRRRACRRHATLIMTAKLNDIDPLAWLADVLARIATSRKPAS